MEKSQETSPITQKPTHIGFICDGNRRWAKERNLPTLEGHNIGFKKVETLIESIVNHNIEFASFYLFSTENWNRSSEEISYLMTLLKTRISSIAKKATKNNIRIVFMFSDDGKLEDSIVEQFRSIESETKDNTGSTICFCINYGGHREIVETAKKIAEENGDFTEENFAKHLYHPEVPPCDMVVRTSGEERISGYMLWRAAYSEFFFIQKYWPDIEPNDIDEIITEYNSRQRRFGK